MGAPPTDADASHDVGAYEMSAAIIIRAGFNRHDERTAKAKGVAMLRLMFIHQEVMTIHNITG